MGVHLRHFPEHHIEMGVFSNVVTGDEMLSFFAGCDKTANLLLIFSKNADISGIDVAHFPAMKRAVTPGESECRDDESKLTAFVNFCEANEAFLRFWVHYASSGTPRSRKRAIFSTVEAACQWLRLPPPVSEALAAATAEAVQAGAGLTASQAETTENRRRVLKAASRLFRERGFEGVNEAEVMEAVGLPHGGFNRYFESKDDLIFQALVTATADFNAPEDLWDYASYYLSAAHKADVAGGCPLAALAQDAARQPLQARAVMTAGLTWHVERLCRSAPGADAPARRRAVIRALSALLGAVTLARLSDDEGLAQEVLNETRAWIAGQGGLSAA